MTANQPPVHAVTPTTRDVPAKQLVSVDACRRILFPDCDNTGPAIRTWNSWIARRYFPIRKIGRRVFIDAAEARAALDRRFTISATPVK